MNVGWGDRRPLGPSGDYSSKNRRTERVRRERTVDTRVAAAVTSTATPYCWAKMKLVAATGIPDWRTAIAKGTRATGS